MPGGCICNLVAMGPVVSEEKSFEIVEGRTDGQTTEPANTISCPGELKNVEGVKVHIQSLVILLFVPSFVKLSQTVSKL